MTEQRINFLKPWKWVVRNHLNRAQFAKFHVRITIVQLAFNYPLCYFFPASVALWHHGIT